MILREVKHQNDGPGTKPVPGGEKIRLEQMRTPPFVVLADRLTLCPMIAGTKSFRSAGSLWLNEQRIPVTNVREVNKDGHFDLVLQGRKSSIALYDTATDEYRITSSSPAGK